MVTWESLRVATYANTELLHASIYHRDFTWAVESHADMDDMLASGKASSLDEAKVQVLAAMREILRKELAGLA